MKFKKYRLLLLFLVSALSFIYIVWFHPWYKAVQHVVVLNDSGFYPHILTVHQGDDVVFRSTRKEPFWPASDPHPLHDLYSGFDAQKPINTDDSWTLKASKLGTWNYHDHLFPAFRGTVVVVPRDEVILAASNPKRADMETLIDKLGPNGAYQQVKKVYSKIGSGFSHTATHLFGEALYDRVGPSGISVCDSNFGFGCYHGFFVRAVSDNGVDMAKVLDAQCVEKFGPYGLGCPHGIGHGLGELFGPEKLNEQLEICATLSWQGSLFGCSGGVFMEHNFPTGIKNENNSDIGIRQVVNSKYYEPCSSVKKRFRVSCYFEQASWWREVFQADYAKIGEMCNNIDIEDQRTACFEGIGDVIASSSDYSLELSIGACAKMPGRYEEALCRAGVSWAFFSNPSHTDNSEKACQGLGDFESLCLKNRILVGG